MKEIKVIVIGGGSMASGLLLKLCESRDIVVVDNDNHELLSGDREEFYINAPPKLDPIISIDDNQSFIQQKMQGKRRTY